MENQFDQFDNYEKTKSDIGYIEKDKMKAKDYEKLGFKCGLEVHQQLKTEKKLFCRCPAGIYHRDDDYDSEVIRHMRPTLSELGEYDGTALMEQKTKKNIIYRINNKTACTYEIDDTPPFPINENALDIAIEIALLLKSSMVGELHITRKQYLDGSIPTGFQRTAIVGIEGEIPLKNKTVKIIQLSIEEDSCREVSDIGHNRIYKTDRLGMPLIETVTYPEMLTPDEAAEACNYIRFLNRSTGKVNTGIGATREDVNVSIKGGTRIEIKGVAHIKWIPLLTHNEAFRQKSLLRIMEILNKRIKDGKSWKINSLELPQEIIKGNEVLSEIKENNYKIYAVNLPSFKGIPSHFTQPGKTFEDEISDRLKVIACLEKPNLISSESLDCGLNDKTFDDIKIKLKSKEKDAQLVFWGPEDDIKTALETIEERCKFAFDGIPEETRKALDDGTTIFERVLPGPDRMYPDTDSAPLSIEHERIDRIKENIPLPVSENIKQMRKWNIPEDTFTFILSRNLFGLLKRIIDDFNCNPKFVGTIIGHTVKHIVGKKSKNTDFDYSLTYEVFKFVNENKLKKDIVKRMLPVVYKYSDSNFEEILKIIKYEKLSEEEIESRIKSLKEEYKKIGYSKEKSAEKLWIMGRLVPFAIGNIELGKLRL